VQTSIEGAMATNSVIFTTLGTIIAGGVLVWFIVNRMRENRARMLSESGPSIAGQDQLEGGAKDPSAFDEPDEDALQEMADLLGEEEDESTA